MADGCSFHHLGNGHELIAFGSVAIDDPISGGDCVRAIATEGFVAAIVQKNDVSAASLVCDFVLDVLGRRRVPVVSGDIPHDRLEAESARDAQDSGAASAERWPKEIGMTAHGFR